MDPEKIAKGYYFTGKPCKHGHVAIRRPDSHCMECRKTRAKERNQRPETKVYMRQWREENTDKRLGYERKWRAENPEKNIARGQNRRAREAGAEGFHTHEDILKLKEEQTCCQICDVGFDKNNPATVDHIKALASGGTNWPNNLQLLCKSCNSSKGAR